MEACIPIEVKLPCKETALERLIKLYFAYIQVNTGHQPTRTRLAAAGKSLTPARKNSGLVRLTAIHLGS
jgi:hypothetical protein